METRPPIVFRLLFAMLLGAGTAGLGCRPFYADIGGLDRQIAEGVQRVIGLAVKLDVFDEHGTRTSSLSGVIAEGAAGLLISVNHGIHSAREILVDIPGTGERMSAKVVCRSIVDDLSLLRLERPVRPLRSVPQLQIAEGTSRVGQLVVALVSPRGFPISPTLGIVGGSVLPHANSTNREGTLQISMATDLGASGGGVFNLQGELLGIVTRGGAGGTLVFAANGVAVKALLACAPSDRPT